MALNSSQLHTCTAAIIKLSMSYIFVFLYFLLATRVFLLTTIL